MQRGKMLGFESKRCFLTSVLFSAAWLIKRTSDGLCVGL